MTRDFDDLRHLLNKCVKDNCFNTTNTDASLSVLNDLCRTQLWLVLTMASPERARTTRSSRGSESWRGSTRRCAWWK
ncbi:hypothetical protein Prudu_007388 [Prunus dulcis]|uniref:Uncharacterized protein n=1 Tax=Prunus dulcis TaxID=3755 RepID=A0A4Y1R200_PRUDU|nr:hypothetical protein Prudu_007388 [Prunus dulcis]